MAIGIGKRKFVAVLDRVASLVLVVARPRQVKAITWRLLGLSAAALAASTIVCFAVLVCLKSSACRHALMLGSSQRLALDYQRRKVPTRFCTISRRRGRLHVLKFNLVNYHQRRQRLSGKLWPERARQIKPATRQLASKRSRRFSARSVPNGRSFWRAIVGSRVDGALARTF